MNPSAWPHRIIVAALACLGALVAAYLSLYQWHLTTSVWDPFFGAPSSQVVLTSPLSRALPLPDAALGAVAYLIEVVLTLLGGADRWHAHPLLVMAFGAALAALAVASLALVLMQLVILRAPCTLCLTSAAISFINAALGRREVFAALRVYRHLSAQGGTLPA